MVSWTVEIGDEFDPEFNKLHEDVRNRTSGALPALTAIRAAVGKAARRHAQRLPPRHMKELRFSAADGEWRVAFAFDPTRSGILLVAGDKSGVSKKNFYKRLIAKADERFDAHLSRLKKKERK